jgi:hypothetical protein
MPPLRSNCSSADGSALENSGLIQQQEVREHDRLSRKACTSGPMLRATAFAIWRSLELTSGLATSRPQRALPELLSEASSGGRLRIK